MFLDSNSAFAQDSAQEGRFDILCAEPVSTLVTRGNVTEICTQGKIENSTEEPFSLLRQVLGPEVSTGSDLPFISGAVGYFSYDLARRIEQLPVLAKNMEQLPEMAVGIYDWAVIVDHQKKRSCLAGLGRTPATREKWDALVALFTESVSTKAKARIPFCAQGEVRANMDKIQYASAFKRIKEYIREGDCYQVNFAQQFSVTVEGDSWLAYQQLREINPAPYSAYLNLPFAQILSSSPETFLKSHDGHVETRPIKGTRPRVENKSLDVAMANELRSSAKDRAENLMIVDLLRNDLGKNCVPGSVDVPALFEVESYARVHHLVSTIRGQLSADKDSIDLLRGCFPGGSITGAPKVRAMEIIEELEPLRRGVYCGSIGYLGCDGNMQTNISIRTLVKTANKMHFAA
ncbi:MAG: aminodeoxychorismate synthase component I, partial [Gammaproteobacteria bacterium]|nr:aminodeoxychorismate synthase component I [Gammaproteobacteria bacterium]